MKVGENLHKIYTINLHNKSILHKGIFMTLSLLHTSIPHGISSQEGHMNII
jgi:hypothetical protein